LRETIVAESDQSLETLAQAVRRTLHDLTEIRQSIAAMAGQASGQSGKPDPGLEAELANHLKCLVAALRELLWTYITTLSGKSGSRPEDALEWYKMELAVGLVNSEKSLSPPAKPQEIEGSGTFQDLIATALAVTAMYSGQEKRV
jgi:hypothetical protein